MPLFDMLDGRYDVVVTNHHLNAENIWRLYNRGAVVEHVIDQIKIDYAATGIRTDSFLGQRNIVPDRLDRLQPVQLHPAS